MDYENHNDYRRDRGFSLDRCHLWRHWRMALFSDKAIDDLKETLMLLAGIAAFLFLFVVILIGSIAWLLWTIIKSIFHQESSE